MMFSKYKILAGILILNTRYKHPVDKNNNIFYLFKNQVDYILVYFFADSETTKCNIDKFFAHPIIKFITQNLLSRSTDK